jgi:4-amino-4-deoxy-L-arabinose transferase-like glycosyltransferase
VRIAGLSHPERVVGQLKLTHYPRADALAPIDRVRYATRGGGKEAAALRGQTVDTPRTLRIDGLLAALLRERVSAIALIVTLGFILRLAWAAYSQWEPLPDDDAFRYHFSARSLAEGAGYVHLNGAPTAFWPPGYPLLLAAAYRVFGTSIEVAQLLNVALGAATVWLVYLIGRRTLGEQPAAVGAALVAAFPSLIFFTAVTLSEIAFTFFALAGVYLLILEAQSPNPRPAMRLLVAAGLVLGFASLVRGQALLLPLVLLPFWLRSGAKTAALERVIAVAFGIALIVAPWTVRNAVQLGAPVLISTNAGVDFWIGHNESAPGDFGASGGERLVLRYPELSSVAREVHVNNEGFREGIEYAITHPREELVLPLKKLFWLYYSDEEALKWNEGHGGQSFLDGRVRAGLLTLSNVYYFAVLVLAFAGARLWLSRRPGPLLLVSLVLYWTFVHLVFFGDPRFHAPMVPVIALLAAPALVALWSGRLPWAREP